jgi:hypothetical protein
MGVNHGRTNVAMAQQFLHGANVVAVGEEVRGKRMPKRVARDSFGESGLSDGGRHCPLNERFIEVMAIANGSASRQCSGLCGAAQALDRRTYLCLDQSLPPPQQGLRTDHRIERSDDLYRHDRIHVTPTARQNTI